MGPLSRLGLECGATAVKETGRATVRDFRQDSPAKFLVPCLTVIDRCPKERRALIKLSISPLLQCYPHQSMISQAAAIYPDMISQAAACQYHLRILVIHRE